MSILSPNMNNLQTTTETSPIKTVESLIGWCKDAMSLNTIFDDVTSDCFEDQEDLNQYVQEFY